MDCRRSRSRYLHDNRLRAQAICPPGSSEPRNVMRVKEVRLRDGQGGRTQLAGAERQFTPPAMARQIFFSDACTACSHALRGACPPRLLKETNATSNQPWPASNLKQVRGNLERAKGFEPSTPTLARSCSTPELHPLPTWADATHGGRRKLMQQSKAIGK
jgi:hypothetical protein